MSTEVAFAHWLRSALLRVSGLCTALALHGCGAHACSQALSDDTDVLLEDAYAPHFPRVDALTRTLELCGAVQENDAVPISCTVHADASGARTMALAFADENDLLEYGGAVHAELALPFCATAGASGETATLIVRVAHAREREYACAQNGWGEAEPTRDALLETASAHLEPH